MTTTTKSLTEQQIRSLRAGAVEAGDLAQIVVCDRALGGTDSRDDYMTPESHERRAFDRAIEMSRDEAIVECVAAINHVEAQ